MAIQFPIPTEVGETHTEAGSTWVWDGDKWSVAMAGDTAIGAQIATPVITDPGVVDPASDLILLIMKLSLVFNWSNSAPSATNSLPKQTTSPLPTQLSPMK